VFDRLSQYKMRRGIPTWEQALENLLKEECGTTMNAELEEQVTDSSFIAHS